MTGPLLKLTPYQAQLRQAHRTRQIKYAAAARRAKRGTAKTEITSRPPVWQIANIAFDAHVKAYQFHLANKMVRPEVSYIKQRCAQVGISYREVIGRSSLKAVVEVRRLLMWEVRGRFGLSFFDVGRAFGGRDQSTAISAIKIIEASRACKQ